jgi:hypothetical protein
MGGKDVGLWGRMDRGSWQEGKEEKRREEGKEEKWRDEFGYEALLISVLYVGNSNGYLYHGNLRCL